VRASHPAQTLQPNVSTTALRAARAGVVVGLIPCVLLTILVEFHSTGGVDRAAELQVHHALTPSLRPFMLAVSAVGAPLTMYCIAGFATLIGIGARMPRWVLTPLPSVGGSQLIEIAMKDAVHRSRPHLWATHLIEHSYSFPSGHATASMACFTALTLLTWSTGSVPTAWAIALTGGPIVLLIGLSRVYLGVHWPTDVIGGWCLALCCVSLVFLLTLSGAVQRHARLRHGSGPLR
jgi:membrane-associated phospholipid phosphatase